MSPVGLPIVTFHEQPCRRAYFGVFEASADASLTLVDGYGDWSPYFEDWEHGSAVN